MSASLLQKSLKLTEGNKELKRKNLKKKKQLNCKWKKTLHNVNESREKESKEGILNNIKKLELLDVPISLGISEKIFCRNSKLSNLDKTDTEEGEKTVFTEKDFEDFEKEYFVS